MGWERLFQKVDLDNSGLAWGLGMMKDKPYKGELSSRENSPMTENSLARAPRNGLKTLLGWMVTRGLWGQKAHIKLSANDRTPLAEL